jgi:hypothetical protein
MWSGWSRKSSVIQLSTLIDSLFQLIVSAFLRKTSNIHGRGFSHSSRARIRLAFTHKNL